MPGRGLSASLEAWGCSMLATQLIRLVETHADELVRAVIRDIRTNPHTASLSRVPEAELTERLRDLYLHLGDWISEQTDERIEAYYSEIGRRRYDARVPLADAVYALIVVKQHLRRFVRDHGFTRSVVEMYSEEQLREMAWSFFDRAVYFMVKGYEDERRGLPATSAVRPT
jgi:hypothetical protein